MFHILTLTRLRTTGTEAGVAGYGVGQVTGMGAWLAIALVVVVWCRSQWRSADSAPAPG